METTWRELASRLLTRSSMRLALVVIVLVGCSSSGEDVCPGSLYCSAAQRGTSCHEDSAGRAARCTCDGATWSCTDCPDGELPTATCSAGASCSVWGFELACACSCDANGAWHCSVDDPSPNFHCGYGS